MGKKEGREGGFKEIEKVHAIQHRKGGELRFSVVEIDGERVADIRYFTQTEEGIKASDGIVVGAVRYPDFMIGAKKLADRLAAKK